jgi:hypothetical protein
MSAMEKRRKTIFIEAPRERVWDVMLGDDTYRDWTTAFSPGSHYEGDWSQGSKIIFKGPLPDGSGEMGMVSRIAENRPHEFISIQHLGIYKNGVEDTESEEAKKWAPAYENYSFAEKNGGTELTLEQDIDGAEQEAFGTMWDAALARLKEIAEGNRG